ncbi:hypothetical protein F5X98DRAFT_258220 [Xylaria grammica]|nr:hypothetical protein F5X98DRAFT_258220 [Xylaria grammica]
MVVRLSGLVWPPKWTSVRPAGFLFTLCLHHTTSCLSPSSRGDRVTRRDRHSGINGLRSWASVYKSRQRPADPGLRSSLHSYVCRLAGICSVHSLLTFVVLEVLRRRLAPGNIHHSHRGKTVRA